ncbi:MAG: inositol-3-phosphate synthase [Fimbriimonadaceae bacterium]|nr:inositol-3-phosphate synthase [Alphaproteobacteria bacterium]
MANKIRVGIVGVGNCASSLVQGIQFYSDAEVNDAPPGIMNVKIGDYHIGDIEIVSAFDIHARKVGQDIAEAIHVDPNNTHVFTDVAPTGVTVSSGPVLDGVGHWLKDVIPLTEADPVNIAETLKATGTEIMINYLPVGSEKAARFYIEEAIKAGCAVVNCVPVFIASDKRWAEKFEAAGLPIIGDDIKSQVGATIVHRVLTQLMGQRGVRLDRTHQLNVGGNSDFRNMLEYERLKSKKISKTQSVISQMTTPLEEKNIHVGPSDYVPWLEDRKWAHIRMEATGFGGTPLNIELKLEVWDSPNSAGVVIDAIRCTRLALDRGIAGPLVGPSSYFMKSPPVQYTDREAHQLTRAFIDGEFQDAGS